MSSQITINYSSSSSSSPATSAASSKVFQIIEGLDPFDEGVSKTLTKALVEGADPLTVDSSTNYSLLYRAAELGKNEVILQLLSTKENGNIDAVCGEKKRSPLFIACLRGHLEVVKTLLSAGARIDQSDLNGFTPLIAALVDSEIEMNKLFIPSICGKEAEFTLLAAGASKERGITQHPFYPSTSHSAPYIEKDSKEILSLLIEHMSPSERIREFDTPIGVSKDTALHIAARNGNAAAVEILIRNGDKIDKTNALKQTPLHLAADEGKTTVVNLLLENAKELDLRKYVNAKTQLHGQTSLHFACARGDTSMVASLLNAGAHIEAEDAFHARPLHYAASAGNFAILILLLERGASSLQKYSSKTFLELLPKKSLQSLLSIVDFDLAESLDKLETRQEIEFCKIMEMTRIAHKVNEAANRSVLTRPLRDHIITSSTKLSRVLNHTSLMSMLQNEIYKMQSHRKAFIKLNALERDIESLRLWFNEYFSPMVALGLKEEIAPLSRQISEIRLRCEQTSQIELHPKRSTEIPTDSSTELKKIKSNKTEVQPLTGSFEELLLPTVIAPAAPSKLKKSKSNRTEVLALTDSFEKLLIPSDTHSENQGSPCSSSSSQTIDEQSHFSSSTPRMQKRSRGKTTTLSPSSSSSSSQMPSIGPKTERRGLSLHQPPVSRKKREVPAITPSPLNPFPSMDPKIARN